MPGKQIAVFANLACNTTFRLAGLAVLAGTGASLGATELPKGVVRYDCSWTLTIDNPFSGEHDSGRGTVAIVFVASEAEVLTEGGAPLWGREKLLPETASATMADGRVIFSGGPVGLTQATANWILDTRAKRLTYRNTAIVRYSQGRPVPNNLAVSGPCLQKFDLDNLPTAEVSQ